jgi:hypothetical protein
LTLHNYMQSVPNLGLTLSYLSEYTGNRTVLVPAREFDTIRLTLWWPAIVDSQHFHSLELLTTLTLVQIGRETMLIVFRTVSVPVVVVSVELVRLNRNRT